MRATHHLCFRHSGNKFLDLSLRDGVYYFVDDDGKWCSIGKPMLDIFIVKPIRQFRGNV